MRNREFAKVSVASKAKQRADQELGRRSGRMDRKDRKDRKDGKERKDRKDR